MNYRGSYRHLISNSKSAMLAAIEIYNKPKMEYRNETFLVLLLSSWESLLKAVLSRNGRSIFYPKKRKQPYRTLSWRDALAAAEQYFPRAVPARAVRRNIDLLATYRDNAVHFYNATGIGVLLYALAQTSIVNYRDLLNQLFGIRIEDEITWQLMPLGLEPPIDPIAYIGQHANAAGRGSSAVRQFITELAVATKELEDAGVDTGRLLTVFRVALQSTKKIEHADVVVGVQAAGPEPTGPLAVIRSVDPNVSHPLRQKDVVEKIGTLHGKTFTQYTFQAVVWKYGIKEKPHLCWRATEGFLTRYSSEVPAWIRSLSKADLEAALTDYRTYQRGRSRRKRNG